MGYCNTGRGADGVLQHRQGTDGGTATQAGDRWGVLQHRQGTDGILQHRQGADGVLQHRQGTDGGYCNTGRGQMGGTATQAGD